MKRVAGGTGRLVSFLGLCMLVLVVLSGPACRKAPPAPDANSPKVDTPAAPNQPAQAPSDKPVVIVNGTVVGEQELDKRVVMVMRQYGNKMASLPPQYVEQVKKQIRQTALDNLITEMLLDEQMRTANIQVTEEEALAAMTKAGAQSKPPVTLEEFRTALEAQGGNFDDYKNEFRKGLAYRKFLEAQFGDKVNATEEEANQYYTANPEDFQTPEQIRASHILISTKPTDPNGDPNQAKVAAREKVDKLLGEVKAGGDFAALAKANSSCPSAEQGGDLGFFPRGKMVKPFEDAAFALKVGQVSDVVETQFGYHIIKVTDHNDAKVTPFEEVKARILEGLTNQKKSTMAREYIESLRQKATIAYPPGSSMEPLPPVPQPTPQTVSPAPQPSRPAPQPSQPAPQPAQPAPASTTEPNAAKTTP